MEKSKIIMELADCSISAEKALKRLYVIASDLNDNDLLSWIEKELNGYSTDEQVPDYRDLGPGSIKYSGIAGTAISYINFKNNAFPLQLVPKEFRDELLHFYCRGTIASIEQEAQSESRICIDLSYLIPYIKISAAISCLYCEYSKTSLREIINKLLAMLLKIFIKLDNSFGNLDSLDIGCVSEEKADEVRQYIHQLVFIDNSIKIGDSNKLEKSSLTTEG